MENRVALNPDHAREVLRHCKRRFAKGRKPVENPGGYISALLVNPSKFGWVQRDGVWVDPEKPSGPTAEEVAARISATKAASRELLARTQADAEKAYADMAATWERLPEEAKKEIREFVQQSSPLFHKSGEDEVEFELQCMREASKIGRTAWRRKHMRREK
jgi:vacuolar-type H+-ATPase subunit H